MEYGGGMGASVGACKDSGKSMGFAVKPGFEFCHRHISYGTLERLLKLSFLI